MEVDRIPLCFPVVFYGLIEPHTDTGNVELINLLFRGAYDPNDYGKDNKSPNIRGPEVSKFINGRDVFRWGKNKSDATPPTLQTMTERVISVNLTEMENTVSGFQDFLEKRGSIDKSDLELLRSIISVDNDPAKYIAQAILLSVKYPAKTNSLLTEDLLDELSKLHLRPGVKNLFRLTKNERLHYEIMRGIPEYITDEALRLIWQKMIEKEMSCPGSISERLYAHIKQMNSKEAQTFLLASPTFLVFPRSTTYFMLDTSEYRIVPLQLWLQDAMYFISILQECGLVRYQLKEHEGIASECGTITFGNSNYDLAVRAYVYQGDSFFTLKIFELTEIGSELYNIMGLKPENDFLLAAAYALRDEYLDDIEFVVMPITKEEFEQRKLEKDKSKDILKDFKMKEVVPKVVDRVMPVAMQLMGAQRISDDHWRL